MSKNKKPVKKKVIKKERVEEYWCPTQGGQYTAYYPEFRHPDDPEWTRIPVKIAEGITGGVPSPIDFGGINSVLTLFGYEQAMALAWHFSAHVMATLGEKSVKVRVQAYEVHYNIKAKKIDF